MCAGECGLKKRHTTGGGRGLMRRAWGSTLRQARFHSETESRLRFEGPRAALGAGRGVSTVLEGSQR